MGAAPRLYGIVATGAPVAAVLRRGPSDWCALGRWDLTSPAYEPGAWIKARVSPQKCDLSPDGRWFVGSVHAAGADWPAGDVYEAVSRLPWLHALAAWGSGSTYTRGLHLTDDVGACVVGAPDVGNAAPLLARHGVARNGAEQFVVERRRGWVEAPETPPRAAGGPWDERRLVTMRRARPGDPAVALEVSGAYAGFRTGEPDTDACTYALVGADDLVVLDDVQWADWAADGRLLVATTDGRLQIRAGDGVDEVTFDHDLAPETPDPQPAPDWARRW